MGRRGLSVGAVAGVGCAGVGRGGDDGRGGADGREDLGAGGAEAGAGRGERTRGSSPDEDGGGGGGRVWKESNGVGGRGRGVRTSGVVRCGPADD
jgi:hypothetical protein